MTELRILLPAAKYLKRVKNKKLKGLYKKVIDAILIKQDILIKHYSRIWRVCDYYSIMKKIFSHKCYKNV